MTTFTRAQATVLRAALNKQIAFLDEAVGNYGEKAASNPDNLPTFGTLAARAQGQRAVLSEVLDALTELLDNNYDLHEATLLRSAINAAALAPFSTVAPEQIEGRVNGLQETTRLIDRVVR